MDNASDEPTEGFSPNLDQLHEVIDKDVVATWHTHPGATANLSVEDWETFIQWPNQLHAIIGTDGVRWYQAVKGAIINV